MHFRSCSAATKLDEIKAVIVALQHKLLQNKLIAAEEQELAELNLRAAPIKKRLDAIRTTEIETIRRFLAAQNVGTQY